MTQILFLTADASHVAPTRPPNDNHERLPKAFRSAGWDVVVRPHDSVRLAAGRVLAGADPIEDFQRVWVLGLGRAETFFDRMQLLRRVPQTSFVTPVDAFVYQHAKYAWSEFMPETHAGNDPGWLAAILAKGGTWIAKPTAGSYGRDVLRLEPGTDTRAALERLTGGELRRYCLVQRFVPEIAQGEKRTLIAGRRVIGSYLRLPGADFRTNLAQHGRAEPTTLTDRERELVARIHAELARERIGFAAIDIAWPYLIEVNLANPGGLATLADIYGQDFTAAVVDAIGASPQTST